MVIVYGCDVYTLHLEYAVVFKRLFEIECDMSLLILVTCDTQMLYCIMCDINIDMRTEV
jgi:hypothetical protein